jgi:hypothetical protein
VKNVLLINAALTILFLSDTYAGSTHEKRIADATPYPLPAGSRLLQDLGFLAFTLNQVEIIMPTRKPRGRKLTRAQKTANRRIARRRVRIEHVNSRVKRCRASWPLDAGNWAPSQSARTHRLTTVPIRTSPPPASRCASRRFHQGFTEVQLGSDFSWHRFQRWLPTFWWRLRPA